MLQQHVICPAILFQVTVNYVLMQEMLFTIFCYVNLQILNAEHILKLFLKSAWMAVWILVYTSGFRTCFAISAEEF